MQKCNLKSKLRRLRYCKCDDMDLKSKSGKTYSVYWRFDLNMVLQFGD